MESFISTGLLGRGVVCVCTMEVRKMDLIEKLFYGRIDPGARGPEHGSEMEELLKRASQNEQLLEESLTGEQKERLSQISKDSDDINMLSELTGFRNGFCLGVRLMMEAACYRLPWEKGQG